MDVAFIGLGVMGFPMAGHLARAGHRVCVYNRTVAKAERWRTTYPGQSAQSVEEAARGASMLFTCVGNDSDLLEVLLGAKGALDALATGAIVVDHSTTSATVARQVHARCAERQLFFLDAPVSGGQSGAERGQLTVMVGGSAQTFATAEPVMRAFAKQCTHMGGPGSGQLTKMVNQICLAGMIQGLAEGLLFAQNAGLNAEKVMDALANGAAQSWQMDNRGRTMIQQKYDFGFAVDHMRKDLDICLDEGARNGSPLPVTALVNQFYADLQAMGDGRLDTSSLLKRLVTRPT